jgi:SOS-response transcriptional repressor LexA
MTIELAELKDRLAFAREKRGFSQGLLAEKAGVTQVTIAHLESGRSRTSKKLVSIARGLGISAEWLETGAAAEENLALLEGKQSTNVAPLEQPQRLYRYPVLSWVAAGNWSEAVEPFEPGAADRFELTDYKGKGQSFWLEVKGDSMTSLSGESIPEGVMILVDTGLEARPGDLVVARLLSDSSSEATFKMLVSDAGQRYLKPLNPAYRMIPIDEKCQIIGVVTESKRKHR